MNANDTIHSILNREGASSIDASLAMGRKRAYISAILSNKRDPKSSTLAEFCEAMGYEVVVRSKRDGFEFTIDE